jgi:hypothetical protein
MSSFKVYCHFEEAEPNMTHGFRLSKADDETRTIGSLLEVLGPVVHAASAARCHGAPWQGACRVLFLVREGVTRQEFVRLYNEKNDKSRTLNIEELVLKHDSYPLMHPFIHSSRALHLSFPGACARLRARSWAPALLARPTPMH